MENASQALKMAGGILIAILILSLLVVAYNSIRGWERSEEAATLQEQASQFNKDYQIYIKDLYGSELLSLVNKAANYNKIESEEKGYLRLEIVVTFKNDIGGFKKNVSYKTDSIISKINSLQSKISTYGNKQYGGKLVSALSLMRTNELKQFIVDKSLNSKAEEIEKNIKTYTDAKADEVTIKSKMFDYVSVSYDSDSGRIKQIKYKEL